jgi:hypothetical protein
MEKEQETPEERLLRAIFVEDEPATPKQGKSSKQYRKLKKRVRMKHKWNRV